MTDLTRVVYLSRNALELEPDEMVSAINEILEVSQDRNARSGVTGALLFNRGFFGQILEGTADAVEETYERIQNDDRHHDVALLDVRTIPERAFASWSMGFVGSDSALRDAAASSLDRTGFDIATLSADEMFTVLSSLAHEREIANRA